MDEFIQDPKLTPEDRPEQEIPSPEETLVPEEPTPAETAVPAQEEAPMPVPEEPVSMPEPEAVQPVAEVPAATVCPNCGTAVSDDSMFCIECGTKVR